MSVHLRAFVGMLIAAAICGCTDHRQAAIDDAYRRGEISFTQKERLTNQLALERETALNADIRWQQEHSIPLERKNRDDYVTPQRPEPTVYDPNGLGPSR